MQLQHTSGEKTHYNNSFLFNRLDRNCRASDCKSPINNLLLDSPPSSRPLTLASRGSSDSLRKTPSYDETNNNPHPALRGHLSTGNQANNYANLMFHKLDENPSSIYHQLLLSPPLRRANTFPDDHVYEVIPAQKAAREQSRVHQKKHYDDNNYLIPSACNSPYPKGEQVRLRRSRENDTSGQSSTNLRSMKRMGRSMDSISRSANGNKLRSQSTVSRMNFFP